MKKSAPYLCPNCGEPQEYTQPIIIDGMTGFTTPVHGCGEGYTAMHLTPASKDSKAFWGKVGRFVQENEP